MSEHKSLYFKGLLFLGLFLLNFYMYSSRATPTLIQVFTLAVYLIAAGYFFSKSERMKP